MASCYVIYCDRGGSPVSRTKGRKAMNQKRLMGYMALFLCIALTSPSAFAMANMDNNVRSDNYGVRAPSRLLHGIVNAGLGWTQLFYEPVHSVRSEGQNIGEGILDGIVQTTYYTVLGAWDIGTFWVPGPGGKDLAAPACVIGKMQGKSSQAAA